MNINLVRLLARIYLWQRPEDPNDVAGYGPFALPPDHPFNRAGSVHDYYFTEARRDPAEGMTLDYADIRLFRMFAFLAMNQPTREKQLDLMMDACLFWPIARDIGSLIWKGEKG